MIRTFDYLREYAEIREEILDSIGRVLESGTLLLGEETRLFEEEFAAYVGAGHCVALTSGTTALQIALLALGVGPGDEVITVSNTCAPTISAIRITGATPVFVDVRESDLLIDPALIKLAVTNKTKCILPVHLWGQAADMDAMTRIAEETGLALIEDCAQAHGTLFREKHVGLFGKAGCFSFYPTKNLGSYGDAGAIVTDDMNFAVRLRSIRMYGYDNRGISQHEGVNGRISELQAAILRVKLKRLDRNIGHRRSLAEIYRRRLKHPSVRMLTMPKETTSSYHQYVVRCRDRAAVIETLKTARVGYGIHYATPVHLMPAYAHLGGEKLNLPVTNEACSQILSLPIHDTLERSEVDAVCQVVNGMER